MQKKRQIQTKQLTKQDIERIVSSSGLENSFVLIKPEKALESKPDWMHIVNGNECIYGILFIGGKPAINLYGVDLHKEIVELTLRDNNTKSTDKSNVDLFVKKYANRFKIKVSGYWCITSSTDIEGLTPKNNTIADGSGQFVSTSDAVNKSVESIKSFFPGVKIRVLKQEISQQIATKVTKQQLQQMQQQPNLQLVTQEEDKGNGSNSQLEEIKEELLGNGADESKSDNGVPAIQVTQEDIPDDRNLYKDHVSSIQEQFYQERTDVDGGLPGNEENVSQVINHGFRSRSVVTNGDNGRGMPLVNSFVDGSDLIPIDQSLAYKQANVAQSQFNNSSIHEEIKVTDSRNGLYLNHLNEDSSNEERKEGIKTGIKIRKINNQAKYQYSNRGRDNSPFNAGRVSPIPRKLGNSASPFIKVMDARDVSFKEDQEDDEAQRYASGFIEVSHSVQFRKRDRHEAGFNPLTHNRQSAPNDLIESSNPDVSEIQDYYSNDLQLGGVDNNQSPIQVSAQQSRVSSEIQEGRNSKEESKSVNNQGYQTSQQANPAQVNAEVQTKIDVNTVEVQVGMGVENAGVQTDENKESQIVQNIAMNQIVKENSKNDKSVQVGGGGREKPKSERSPSSKKLSVDGIKKTLLQRGSRSNQGDHNQDYMFTQNDDDQHASLIQSNSATHIESLPNHINFYGRRYQNPSSYPENLGAEYGTIREERKSLDGNSRPRDLVGEFIEESSSSRSQGPGEQLSPRGNNTYLFDTERGAAERNNNQQQQSPLSQDGISIVKTLYLLHQKIPLQEPVKRKSINTNGTVQVAPIGNDNAGDGIEMQDFGPSNEAYPERDGGIGYNSNGNFLSHRQNLRATVQPAVQGDGDGADIEAQQPDNNMPEWLQEAIAGKDVKELYNNTVLALFYGVQNYSQRDNVDEKTTALLKDLNQAIFRLQTPQEQAIDKEDLKHLLQGCEYIQQAARIKCGVFDKNGVFCGEKYDVTKDSFEKLVKEFFKSFAQEDASRFTDSSAFVEYCRQREKSRKNKCCCVGVCCCGLATLATLAVVATNKIEEQKNAINQLNKLQYFDKDKKEIKDTKNLADARYVKGQGIDGYIPLSIEIVDGNITTAVAAKPLTNFEKIIFNSLDPSYYGFSDTGLNLVAKKDLIVVDSDNKPHFVPANSIIEDNAFGEVVDKNNFITKLLTNNTKPIAIPATTEAYKITNSSVNFTHPYALGQNIYFGNVSYPLSRNSTEYLKALNVLPNNPTDVNQFIEIQNGVFTYKKPLVSLGSRAFQDGETFDIKLVDNIKVFYGQYVNEIPSSTIREIKRECKNLKEVEFKCLDKGDKCDIIFTSKSEDRYVYEFNQGKTSSFTNCRLSDLQTQVESLKSQVKTLSEQSKIDKSTIKTLNDKITKLEGQVNNLTGQANADAQKIADLNSQITALQTEIANCKKNDTTTPTTPTKLSVIDTDAGMKIKDGATTTNIPDAPTLNKLGATATSFNTCTTEDCSATGIKGLAIKITSNGNVTYSINGTVLSNANVSAIANNKYFASNSTFSVDNGGNLTATTSNLNVKIAFGTDGVLGYKINDIFTSQEEFNTILAGCDNDFSKVESASGCQKQVVNQMTSINNPDDISTFIGTYANSVNLLGTGYIKQDIITDLTNNNPSDGTDPAACFARTDGVKCCVVKSEDPSNPGAYTYSLYASDANGDFSNSVSQVFTNPADATDALQIATGVSFNNGRRLEVVDPWLNEIENYNPLSLDSQLKIGNQHVGIPLEIGNQYEGNSNLVLNSSNILQLSGGGTSFDNQQKAISGGGGGNNPSYPFSQTLGTFTTLLSGWLGRSNPTPEASQIAAKYQEASQAPSIFSHLAKEEKLGISEPKVSLNKSKVPPKVDKKVSQENEKEAVINFYPKEERGNKSKLGGKFDKKAEVINEGKKKSFVEKQLQNLANQKGLNDWNVSKGGRHN